MDWIHVAFVNTVMSVRVPQKVGDFTNDWDNISLCSSDLASGTTSMCVITLSGVTG
jgi:hypothetical protein